MHLYSSYFGLKDLMSMRYGLIESTATQWNEFDKDFRIPQRNFQVRSSQIKKPRIITYTFLDWLYLDLDRIRSNYLYISGLDQKIKAETASSAYKFNRTHYH